MKRRIGFQPKPINDPQKYKVYEKLGNEVANPKLNWKEVAGIDEELTKKWVNKDDIVAHSISVDVDLSGPRLSDAKLYLDNEYKKSSEWVNYRLITYLVVKISHS